MAQSRSCQNYLAPTVDMVYILEPSGIGSAGSLPSAVTTCRAAERWDAMAACEQAVALACKDIYIYMYICIYIYNI